jgi:hypothetical protein
MRDAPAHTCPGPGCASQVPTEMLACREHWFQVPKALRDEVWASWRQLRQASAAAVVHDMDLQPEAEKAERRHDTAMRAAIETMTEARRG